MSEVENGDEKKSEGPCNATVTDKNPPCPNECDSPKCKSFKDGPKVDLRDHVFVWLYGGPSVGKTTICNSLCSKYGLTRVHIGDLLLQEVARGSVRAKCVQDNVDRGELIPNDIVIMLVKRYIEAKAEGTKGFVLDGYPREKEQGELFESTIAPVTAFLFLDADRKSLYERHVSRPQATQKRWPTAEDKNVNIVAHKVQIHIFFQNHKQIMDQYPNRVIRINSENRPSADIFSDIVKYMDRAVARLKLGTVRRKAEEAKLKPVEPEPEPEPVDAV